MPPFTPLSTEVHHARLTSPTRLAALRATGLLNGESSPVLDRLTRLVTRLLNVPVALVSLVDDQGQHFPGLTGLGGWAGDQRGTPLTHSFCQHVVVHDEALLVHDAMQHPLVRDNLALSELGVVAYAGVPLRNAEGETFGALCAIDSVPVTWTDDQVATLEDLAAAAMSEIELRATTHALLAVQERLRAQAVRDELTGLYNRRGFGEQARRHVAAAERSGTPFLVLALDLDGFKQINDTLGHDAGDAALVDLAAVLLETCRESDIVGRMGGDEFVLLVANSPAAHADAVRDRLLAAIARQNAEPLRDYQLQVSIGIAPWSPLVPLSLAALLRTADEAMYREKRVRHATATPRSARTVGAA